jgi:O-methyltransferase
MIKKARKLLTYAFRILFPDSPTSVMLRCLTYIETTNEKWVSRGSAKGLDPGHYFEFGVWNGVSLLRFWKCTQWMLGRGETNRWKIFGFDSFEGLPKPKDSADTHEFVGEGSFRSEGVATILRLLESNGCKQEKIKLIPGFFDESLTADLKKTLDFPKASLVNIDVDYYSSTIDVLDWIEDLMHDGTLIYFDDINFYNRNPKKGQVKAITDFNNARDSAGLAPIPGLDRFERVYVYWKDSDDNAGERLEF